MAKSCKYYKQQRQVSYDNGVTWINLEEYRQGALIEVNSSDCTSPSTRIYRWAKASTDDYVCVGYDKHYKEYYQYSTDNGATWQNVVPTSSRTSNDVIEYNSVDCGVTPQYIYRWVKTDITTCVENAFDGKYIGYYNNGTSYSAECNSYGTITTAETRPSGYEYSGLTSASVGDCVQAIYGFGVSYGDTSSLSSVTLSNNVRYIGQNTFSHCDALVRINSNVDGVINLPSGVTYIGSGAFYDCDYITTIDIPTGVTRIEDMTFDSCSRLRNVTLPSGVTYIGLQAFNLCAFSAFTIPSSVTEIGLGAFEGCCNLKSISIPSGVASIGNQIFWSCESLTSCTFEEGSQITAIPDLAFQSCSLTSIDIPSGVTTIGYRALAFCTGLTSVTLPSSITSIGQEAFNSSTSLTRVNSNVDGVYNLPSGVTSIGEGAFADCYSLRTISIPTGVTSIGNHTFRGCSGLTSVTIPTGVTSIGKEAFGWCRSLTSVTCLATTPPTLDMSGNYGVFYYTNNCPIYVPSGSVNTYKSATGWSTYADRIQAIP